MLGRYQFYSLHGDRAGRAARSAQAAADTTGLVLDNRALLAAVGQAPVTREQRRLQILSATQVGDIHQSETILRADVRAATAKDAFVAIEHWTDVAFEAANRLYYR